MVNLNQGLIVNIFLSFQLFIAANKPGPETADPKEQRCRRFRNRLPVAGSNSARIIIKRRRRETHGCQGTINDRPSGCRKGIRTVKNYGIYFVAATNIRGEGDGLFTEAICQAGRSESKLVAGIGVVTGG